MTRAERHYTLLFRSQRPNQGMQSCYRDARRHIHFRETLSAQVKEHKRRSAAAKKAWKKRRKSS